MNEINYSLLEQVHRLRPSRLSRIIGVGSYLPADEITSIEIMKEINTDQKYGLPCDWMDKKMGISARRMSKSEDLPSDLAIKAAEEALENSPEVHPRDIDAVIFCGIERDKPEPATAHIIQNKLGLNAAFTFDVANACFGFFQGLSLADSLIDTGTIDYALIVTGEVTTQMSRAVIEQLKEGVSPSEARNLWGMLSVGDAGGAMIIGPSNSNKRGFSKFHQLSESRHHTLCHYKWKENGRVDAHMNMSQIVARGLKLNLQVYDEIMENLGWQNVDWVIAHQTGKVAFEQVQRLHQVDKCKVIKTYPDLGNITTATLPVCFKKLMRSGSLLRGDTVAGLFAGSGLVAGQFGYIA